MKKDRDKYLGDRISWLRADRGLKQTEAAHDIGVAIGTYQLFEYGNHPSRKNIERILDFYQCSRSWLLTGEGVPYPDRPQEKPDAPVPIIPQPTARSGAPAAIPQPFQIDLGEDVRLAIEVLSSNTHYASSLHMNIHSFAAAVTDNKRLTVLEETQRQLEVKINSMESRMEEMIVQNKALQKEVNRLKATYEDSDGGNGSLTNTSGNG